MPENSNLDGNQVSPAVSSQAPQTAGQVLKQARLKAGVHLAVLSAALKVPVRQLEALEADQYLSNQSPVFVRGLASSVCRQLRIDPAPVLALLPQPSSYSESFAPVRHDDVAPARLGILRHSSERFPLKAFWAALVMAILTAGLIWLPGPSQWTLWVDVTNFLKISDPISAKAPLALPEGTPSVLAASDAASLGGVTVVPSEPVKSVESPSSVVASQPDVSQPSSSVVLPDPGKVPLSVNKSSVPEWVFTATSESWLEVRDGQNRVLWSGVLKTGNTRRLQVPLPVSVVVGRADALQVSFKGQTFDLRPHSKMNVARFEVKP